MHRAALLLTLESDLVFSARAATQGGHGGLDCIPGAALLGWAATHLYSDENFDAFTAFHSGKVRFGNGLPLAPDGKIGFPVPQVLRERKGKRDGIKDDRLVPQHLRVAPQAFADNEPAEPLKPCYVTPDCQVITPRTGYRLKTAIENGRAAESQLFGYQHIAAGTRFAASLEADEDVPVALFQGLLDVFCDRTIVLGRSRRAEYGGEISCECLGPIEIWPSMSGANRGEEITIWLLSDLAIEDASGAPSLSPPSELLGLPSGSRCLESSAVTIRRYSPFNGYLRRPEMERTVIAAGSVLRYSSGSGNATPIDCAAGFGLYREQGLGRVWINPPLIAGLAERPVIREPEFLPQIISEAAASAAEPDGYTKDLLVWVGSAMAEDRFHQDCDMRIDQHFSKIETLYATARSIGGNPLAGPGRSQWSRIMGLCSSTDISASRLRHALITNGKRPKGEALPICEGNGWDDQGVTGDGTLQSFTEWMRSVVDDPRWREENEIRALKETLGRLAERVRGELVKEG